MAFQLKQPIVPSLFTILLLLSIMPSSHAKAKPCKCPDSDHDGWRNYTFDDPGFLFQLIDKDSKSVRTVDPLDLNFFRNLSDAELKNSAALSTIDTMIPLWQDPFGGYLEEASFSVNIVYQPVWSDESQNQSSTPAVYSGLAFLILPIFEAEMFKEEVVSYTLAKTLVASVGSLKLHGRTSRNAPVSGSSVSVTTGYTRSRDDNLTVGGNIMRVDITIDTTHTAAAFYSVWIDYDSVGRRLSVYVEVEGNPKPNNPIAEVHLNVSSVAESYVAFGLLSTAAQLLASGGINWSAAVEALPYTPYGPYGPTGYLHRGLSRQVTILSSVLGSVAATALMATAVACYLNSRYRRWHGDLDQLARTMERLPGVPTKVEFADIKKATRNFHEDMKLGGGGFGTVYRCTLSAVMSKTERPIDVAVKRFTRDVQNQRYDDFLAEVSIINRLRHKNIVPLVGWSYNKGEPLLVFEFMTNGSLDQHLFPKNHNGNSRRNGTGIKWATRYEIVRDIATGLHYVHHEYEPMVLHRDIKVSNVMLDSMFRARLGDFGLACTVAVDRNSATGGGGTWGYIAPEYAMCGRATRQTDVFALGVLILEVITGQRALIHEAVDDDDVHITDRVWRVRRGGRLLECVHAVMLDASYDDEEQLVLGVRNDVERLLLLGLACSNPNPLDRPTMPEVVQIIAKSAPPLEVPLLKPRFVWPASEGVVLHNDDSVGTSMTSNLHTSMASTAEKGSQSKVSLGQLMAVSQTRAAGGHPRFNWSTLFLSQPPVLSAPTANLIIQTVLAKLFPFIKLASTDLRMVVST